MIVLTCIRVVLYRAVQTIYGIYVFLPCHKQIGKINWICIFFAASYQILALWMTVLQFLYFPKTHCKFRHKSSFLIFIVWTRFCRDYIFKILNSIYLFLAINISTRRILERLLSRFLADDWSYLNRGNIWSLCRAHRYIFQTLSLLILLVWEMCYSNRSLKSPFLFYCKKQSQDFGDWSNSSKRGFFEFLFAYS